MLWAGQSIVFREFSKEEAILYLMRNGVDNSQASKVVKESVEAAHKKLDEIAAKVDDETIRESINRIIKTPNDARIDDLNQIHQFLKDRWVVDLVEGSGEFLRKYIDAPTRKTLTAADVAPGMEINPAEVNIFRGGNSLQARPIDYKIDKATGLVKTTHGLSLDVSAEAMSRFGGAYRIESIPAELKIIQRGKKLGHFEIVPREAMSPQKFQELLDQIKIVPAD